MFSELDICTVGLVLVIFGLLIWIVYDEIILWRILKEKSEIETENWQLKRRLTLHRTK